NGDGTLTESELEAFREERKSSASNDRLSRKKEKFPPTFPNVTYGDHERQKFDVWIPEKSDDPRLPPILVYFHGGGFVSGDKSQFDPASYLEAGIACVSVNYRLVDGESTISPIPFEDSTLALQSIRHGALDWGIDPGRIALSGGSAGAVIALWLSYHDDQADPSAGDPVRKESTRVDCVVPINGPTNLLPDWIVENIGGSDHVHGSFPKLFGEPVTLPVSDSLRRKVVAISPWEFLTPDDPPTYLVYSGPLDETPLPATATTGKVIHHPAFGEALKERLDEMGVENEFRYGFDPRGTPTISEYLMTQFGMLD
ncbi:MAG: alpha/beta hydrolase, partial [Verrucomicrobiota bacterium]